MPNNNKRIQIITPKNNDDNGDDSNNDNDNDNDEEVNMNPSIIPILASTNLQ